MKLSYIRSLREWIQYQQSEKIELDAHYQLLDKSIPDHEGEFKIRGYSWTAAREVDFLCDFKYSSGFPSVNWRERLECPVTFLNNRTRFSMLVLDLLGDIRNGDYLYIMEQTTPLFKFLNQKFENLIGSEFLGAEVPCGSISESGIRHEDATKLSFNDNQLKVILSFDVFEHIPNYKKAFAECCRALQNSGTLIFAVPFRQNSEDNLIRATLQDDGSVNHICGPEFHGDPINSEEGVLCFQHFGWSMLRELKDCGFADTYAVVGFSEELGNFTSQIVFLAKK
ncbi:MAG: hypothetical protein CMN58_04120 [Solibacterales bacterium]|nr:hypothetical protein [Bryobacterales bacterium]|tara:strand:+ start:9157 stop:10002 length:846 start_codon:yes stop_codon:yes gene_type:complete